MLSSLKDGFASSGLCPAMDSVPQRTHSWCWAKVIRCAKSKGFGAPGTNLMMGATWLPRLVRFICVILNDLAAASAP